MKRIDRLFHFVETRPASDRAILKFLLLCSLGTLLFALISMSTRATIGVPERGGILSEGIVGTPRFINPLLAATSADRDLSALIYAGLMRLGSDGSLHPDMAESLTVSDDGLTYNIVLRSNNTFHDDIPVTADDVIFTILRAQDPMLKSPLRANWEGVTIERIGEYELNLVLSEPYAPFIENLTMGILPRHIWEFAEIDQIPFSPHNSEPIGSGPYMIKNTKRNSSGIPDAYILSPFDDYHGDIPRIATLNVQFFQNEEALLDALIAKKIDSAASLSPQALDTLLANPSTKDSHTLYRTPLPRTFALFFNQNEEPLFREPAVRKALNTALDRDRIVQEVLGGYGQPIDGPLPPGFTTLPTYSATSTTPSQKIDAARDILREGGFKINETTGLWEKKVGTEVKELKFSIETANTDTFVATAEILKTIWGEVGIPVDIKKFEQSDLTQTIIRPRKYSALLFGTAVGRELDFYSFWHSSQRNDPGLNIALYANITTDAVLTEARTKTNRDDRAEAYKRFADEMRTDLPALFLFVPEFTYLLPDRIHEVTVAGLAGPSERFSSIGAWYTNTESVWPFFNNTK